MTEEETERLARLANACGSQLGTRILIALIRCGKGQKFTMPDLALKLVDQTFGKPAPHEIFREAVRLKKDEVIGLEKGPRPEHAVCWLTDDGVFADLAYLIDRAQHETLSDY